jgi:hypothetical protein
LQSAEFAVLVLVLSTRKLKNEPLKTLWESMFPSEINIISQMAVVFVSR